MISVLDDATTIDGYDTVGVSHGRHSVRDDNDSAIFGNRPHALLDDSLAFIVQRAGGFIEDQDARICVKAGSLATRNVEAEK